MFLDSKNIPELQWLIQQPQNGGIEKIKGADISLSVALFLVVTHRALCLAGNSDAAGKIAHLGLPGVSLGINCISSSARTPCAEPFGAPSFELYRIGSRQDVGCESWILFCDRFRRSADGGRNGKMYKGIGAVLGEMGDNVVWHAFETGDRPCPAIAGFHVFNGYASFCVADAGQGFLKSLQRAPKWAGLKTDNEALDAVVTHHATSKPNESEGGGFNDLFNNLLDFNGLVVLRTGRTALHMVNKGPKRDHHPVHSRHIPGSSITAVFSQREQPREMALKNIS